jgi:hypothetical protein
MGIGSGIVGADLTKFCLPLASPMIPTADGLLYDKKHRPPGTNVSRETFVDVPVLLFLYLSCYQDAPCLFAGLTESGVTI